MSDNLFDGLFVDEDERSSLLDILREVRGYKVQNRTAQAIREVIPIDEWLDSEYYLGPDYVRVYDLYKEEAKQIFRKGNTTINEIILTGGIGTGKSTFALLCMIRKLYELSCWSNIPALFNLMSSSKIVFSYFSVTLTQAELTGFGQLREMMDSIPYFQKEFKRNQRLNSLLVWAPNLMFGAGSTGSHAIGMNMIGAILDEANFFQGESTSSNVSSSLAYSKVSRLYTSVVNRSKSRFMTNDRDDSLSILVSSSTCDTSLTEQRIRASEGDPTSKVISVRLWDVKPDKYSKEKFWVFRGNDLMDPFIADSEAELAQLCEAESIAVPVGKDLTERISKLPDKQRTLFIDIPVNFKKSFEMNLIASLQDIAGSSTTATGRLFSSRPYYRKAVREGFYHPFTKTEFIIATGDKVQVSDYLLPNWKPKDVGKKRYVHIDQSLSSDHTGICSVYVDHVEMDGDVVKPVIGVDFILEILPPKPPRKISIPKVRDFLFYMQAVFKITFGMVTYDAFASAESLQVLEERGIPCKVQSVDRTDQAYIGLTNLFYEERFMIYDHEKFRNELFDLIHDRQRRKVNHPTNSSKDVSDAVAGAVNNALSDETAVIDSSGDVAITVELMKAIFTESEDDPFTMHDLLGDDFEDSDKMSMKKGPRYYT